MHFARPRPEINLIHTHFTHSSPTMRQLQGVDMQLQHNKVVNLRLAVQRLNKTVLQPGDTFSYWKLIGCPTKRKGYLPGMILQSGKFTSGTGGGLCQLSNLLYWMTLHTPLTVTERHRHSYDVFPDAKRTQPFGSGATCCYNYLDLCIQNNTPHPFQLFVEITPTHLTGRWCSDVAPAQQYEVYEAEHRMEKGFWGGYSRHNILRRRTLSLSGEELFDEFITENHALMMYQPFLTNCKQNT